ncbi:hypothetical protein [Streptomyces sp. CB01635]|uniref:hypothetical protein n=1 Tax=unclassified Streptomyces TaxID=2593676 RepID=UPI0018FF0A0A|nr:hypothetical protein [Streptomyces sp. CB01635]
MTMTLPTPPTAPPTLADLTARTGLDVLDHLEREVTIPVVDGLQAQGDLIVIPYAFVARHLREPWRSDWQRVPAAGIELLRSAAGGHPHTLVADEGVCRWTARVVDATGLALGMIENTAVAYLIHPEHGGTGIAPGRYLVRRQRERAASRQGWRGGDMLVAD